MSTRYIKNDIGIVSFMAYPEIADGKTKVIENIKKTLLDPYFTLIEITSVEEEHRKTLKDLFEISNIKVCFGAHPMTFKEGLDLNSLDKQKRESSLSRLKGLLEEAYYFDSKSFVFVSGPKPADISKINDSKKALLDSIFEICNYNLEISKKYSSSDPIDIILEIFDDRPFAKNRLAGPLDIVKEIAEDVCKQNDNFGLLFDLSHIPILGEDFTKTLSEASKYIKHIHIGNCILEDTEHPAYGDEHPRICLQGGKNFIEELAGFLAVLKNIGYLNRPGNPISFEVKPLRDEDPDLTVAGSKRIFDRALKMINI